MKKFNLKNEEEEDDDLVAFYRDGDKVQHKTVNLNIRPLSRVYILDILINRLLESQGELMVSQTMGESAFQKAQGEMQVARMLLQAANNLFVLSEQKEKDDFVVDVTTASMFYSLISAYVQSVSEAEVAAGKEDLVKAAELGKVKELAQEILDKDLNFPGAQKMFDKIKQEEQQEEPSNIITL